MSVWLQNFIKKVCYKEGNFTLASGKQSNYYLDLKPALYNPKALQDIAFEISSRLDSKNINIQAVGGIEVGAIPIAIAVSIFLPRINAFFVRKAVKNHGTKAMIEGYPVNGLDVLIVEDVVTTGDSTMHAVTEVQKAGGTVKAIIPIVCRNEGGRDRFVNSGYTYLPLFTLEDFK